MQAYYANLTPEERWAKVGEILQKSFHRLKLEERNQGSEQRLVGKDFYFLSEAAKVLGVSYRTIQRWNASGKLIPAKMENGRWLIDAKQVHRFKNIRHFRRYPLPKEKREKIVTVHENKPVLSNHGIVRRKLRGKKNDEVLRLLCPNDKKCLGEVPIGFFYSEKRGNQPVGPTFIHCSKCGQIIRFQKKYSNHYKFHKEE